MEKIVSFSILIPTFNRASYLRHLLEHIQNNIEDFDYSYEILISDNASSDNTLEVLKSYENKIKYSYFIQNSHTNAEKNFEMLINKCKGEYFIYLADDDNLISNFLIWLLQNYNPNQMQFVYIPHGKYGTTRKIKV